jgi:inorganic pyrophosphatase
LRSVGFVILIFGVLISCRSELPQGVRTVNGFYNAVVSISSGELPLDATGQSLLYLAPPFNIAFLPGTEVRHPLTAETGPVKVLIIGSRLEAGSSIEIRPLGLMKMSGQPGWFDRVIAIPLDPSRGMSGEIKSFFDLQRKCLTCVKIIYEWSLNEPPNKEMVFRGWGTELEAEQFIFDHMKNVSAR